MKYLFWLLVILLVWWAFKRAQKPAAHAAPTSNASEPQGMVRCAHCGIHLPREEAVRGERGDYCCTEHRTAAQDRNPA